MIAAGMAACGGRGAAKKTAQPPVQYGFTVVAEYPHDPAAYTQGLFWADGAMYRDGDGVVSCGIFETEVVDTTAAGDTFIGYFLAAVAEGKPPEAALRLASRASSITVSRPGAADSIPLRAEVAPD